MQGKNIITTQSSQSNELKASEEEDFLERPVPSNRRYDRLSMSLLWITMMTNFPMCLLGFEWYRTGFSFLQVIVAVLVGSIVVYLYTAVACYIGALTGLTYANLAKRVFGRVGSYFVCAIWSCLFFLWYAYMAGYIASMLKALFTLSISLPVLAALMAILMSLNNIFGFKGVTNFARYVAAPCLICWIVFIFIKASCAMPSSVLTMPSTQTWAAAFTTISSLIAGASIWGNEPDFWRFGKPEKLGIAVPILFSVLIGEILFPITGWMVGYFGHVREVSTAISFLNTFSFGQGNNGILAALVLVISCFAVNDGNFYGAVNGFESIFHSSRGRLILPLIFVSSVFSAWLSYRTDALDICATFNAFLLPSVTIIIGLEFFFFKSVTHLLESKDVSQRAISGAACLSLALSWSIGVMTSGCIPIFAGLHIGMWPLYAWFTAAISYITFRAAEMRKSEPQMKRAE